MKRLAKKGLHALCLGLTFPLAAAAGFGRWVEPFRFGAQLCALAPGVVGDYLRVAYYCLTLQSCSPECRIAFGSIFAHPVANLAENVSIGAYCVFGKCRIGARSQIASGVQILSGRRQHDRLSDGSVAGSQVETFETIEVGADCWIGAASIIMASVGSNTTIGAGSVVVRPIPAGVVAVGNPARMINQEARR